VDHAKKKKKKKILYGVAELLSKKIPRIWVLDVILQKKKIVNVETYKNKTGGIVWLQTCSTEKAMQTI
jgi:hypothetical protein